MVFLRWGSKLGQKWASPQARQRGERMNAKLDSWSVRHRLWSSAIAAAVGVAFAWVISVKYDGATTGEFVLWSLVLAPIGFVGEWIRVTRLKRRNARNRERSADGG
ncbi:hypothetical protein [Amycolatopsis sp. lyj-346]|uniref:hypothetical protein n=1 Tax=Amycolatopsis sp. lyj-346 TaxID=2789289 RepID=UPI00397CD346